MSRLNDWWYWRRHLERLDDQWYEDGGCMDHCLGQEATFCVIKDCPYGAVGARRGAHLPVETPDVPWAIPPKMAQEPDDWYVEYRFCSCSARFGRGADTVEMAEHLATEDLIAHLAKANGLESALLGDKETRG